MFTSSTDATVVENESATLVAVAVAALLSVIVEAPLLIDATVVENESATPVAVAVAA